MPKVPKIKKQPNAPTQASFITRGTSSAQQSASGPAKLLNPIVGFSQSNTGLSSLLGGL